MPAIRRCHSLPTIRVHAFSTKAVGMLKGPMDLVPTLEKAGLAEILPLEFAEWITRRLLSHFLSRTNPGTVVYGADVISWIGNQRYTTAQNNITLGFLGYFDNRDGIVVLLVALYYVTSQHDRFTYANLSKEIREEIESLDEEPRISEAVRFSVFIYASAVWLAATWLLDDVEGERHYWEHLMCSADIQGAQRNTRSILEVMEHRLSVDLGDLDNWVDETMEQFPLESF